MTEIFGRVNPWVRDGGSGGVEDQNDRVYAGTPTMRAAAANHLHKGADGICECTCCPLITSRLSTKPMLADIHSMRWPLGEPETDFLRELGDRGAPFRGDR